MAASYKKLFKLLIDREMKSKELAAKAGISPATLAKMKKDGATVSSDVLVKICTALSCTMDDIVEIVPNNSYERRRILIFTGTTYGLIKFYMLKAFFEIFKCCLGVILTSIKYCRVQIEPSYMAVCNTAPPITENRFIQPGKIHQKLDSFSCCKERYFCTHGIRENIFQFVQQGNNRFSLIFVPLFYFGGLWHGDFTAHDNGVLSRSQGFCFIMIAHLCISGYESISVHADEKGHISIFLNENTGEQINLNETSAGRRWYFTYYFVKNILSEGDIFIIDEPAAMLHPSAQREVLRELIELTKRGIKVVYSTHSPYLIPDERRCVHFVMMTEDGTKVNGVSSNQELINQMADIIGEDIFDIQTVFDMYAQGDTTEIGRKCYNAIKRQGEKLEDAASKLFVSVETIKSWNRNGNHFRCPKLENIIAVSKYTNIKIQDLLN